MVELKGAKVVLRDKRIQDAEKDYRWRSDPEIARLDASQPLSMSYDRFLKLFQSQMRYPTPGSHHFGADAIDGTYIGNCMYYDLDSIKREAEMGIVIGDRDYWSNSYGYDAVTTLLDYLFSQMKLNRVYLHTLEWNERALRAFTRCGFKPVRRVRRLTRDFILMEVLRQDWFATAEQRLAARYQNAPQSPNGKPPTANPPPTTQAAPATGTAPAIKPTPAVKPTPAANPPDTTPTPHHQPKPRRRSVFPRS